jgi:hypothetical protein
VPRVTYTDSRADLVQAQEDLLAELVRLRREEEYLVLKVRQAREQVRYYEGLLELLRRDWGKAPGLSEFVRKLG